MHLENSFNRDFPVTAQGKKWMRASASISLSEAGRLCWWSFEKRPKPALPSAAERNEPSLEGIAMKLIELSELLGDLLSKNGANCQWQHFVDSSGIHANRKMPLPNVETLENKARIQILDGKSEAQIITRIPFGNDFLQMARESRRPVGSTCTQILRYQKVAHK
jgi:hypothetical protein